MSLLDRLQNHKKPENPLSVSPVHQPAPGTEVTAVSAAKPAASTQNTLDGLENTVKFADALNDRERRRAFLKAVLDIHRALINESGIDINKLNIATTDQAELKKLKTTIEREILVVLETKNLTYSRKEKAEIIEAVIAETIGLGPIEDLVKDNTINEIMVNGCDQVYIERQGKIELSPVVFFDDDHVRRIIARIVAKIGRRIDEGMPMVDARLRDGSRVNAIIPPLALTGPTLTIRKFSEKTWTAKDLIKFGSLDPAIEEFLKVCVEARLNIIVSGGTGSGKTTLLNVLSSFIPNNERIITIEDSAELKLEQEHVITLETRPPNIENTGEITIRDLVRNSLRMRPDRLLVGEVRGGEALDMLQAMNTGHDGSMTTAHANSPRDLIARVETMVLMAGIELPVKAIRQQISSAFNLIIQQSRLQDGSRKVVKISEICGMEGDMVLLKDLFIFKQTGFNEKTKKVEGYFTAMGMTPSFIQRIESQGFSFPAGLFQPASE
jgi:pilus assembly protein CpaF